MGDGNMTMEVLGYPQKTVFEQLDDAAASWGVYFGDLPTSRRWSSLEKFHMYFFYGSNPQQQCRASGPLWWWLACQVREGRAAPYAARC